MKSAARALAIWLSLAALSVQAMAPLCLAGLMAPAAAGGFPILLCTGHGFQTITVDAKGNPVPSAPSPDDQNSTCPLCSAIAQVAHFTAPVPVLLLIPIAFGRLTAPMLPAPFRLARVSASYVTRAPPIAALLHPI